MYICPPIPGKLIDIYVAYSWKYIHARVTCSRELVNAYIAYVKPGIGENKFSSESVTYEGVGSTKKWERIESMEF